MSSLLLLIACLVLGAGIARFGAPPPTLPQGLNWWVLNVALPALILQLIPGLQFDWHLWFLPASMWFVFFGAWGFFALIGQRLHWSRGQIGALTLVCGLGNTSFVGYPLLETLRGHEALAYGVVADQLGSFLMLAIGGGIVAAVYSGDRPHPREIARKVLLSPSLFALLAGLAAGYFGGWPPLIADVLIRLGSTLVPLALFSVGLQLRLRLAPGQMTIAAIGLSWKLVLAAAAIFACGHWLDVGADIRAIATLQAAMAPMISAAILANQHELDPPLTTSVLGIGILISLVSVPLLNLALSMH